MKCSVSENAWLLSMARGINDASMLNSTSGIDFQPSTSQQAFHNQLAAFKAAFSSACLVFFSLASKIFRTLLSPAIHFSTSTSSLPSSSFFAFVSLSRASLRFCSACRWSSNCCRAACSSWIRATVRSCSSLAVCSGCEARNSSGVVSGRLLKTWLLCC